MRSPDLRLIDLVSDKALFPERCADCCFWETELAGAPGECPYPEGKKAWVAHVIENGLSPGKIALSGGEPVGLIKYAVSSMVPRLRTLPYPSPGERSLYIMCVYVIPPMRGLGIGKKVVREAMKSAVLAKLEFCETNGLWDRADVPPGPVGFFESCGFRVVTSHADAPLMRLQVRSLSRWPSRLIGMVRKSSRVAAGKKALRGSEKPCS